MKFYDLLSIVFFILNEIAFFYDFVNHAGIELSIPWVDCFAMSAFREKGRIWLFENF